MENIESIKTLIETHNILIKKICEMIDKLNAMLDAESESEIDLEEEKKYINELKNKLISEYNIDMSKSNTLI